MPSFNAISGLALAHPYLVYVILLPFALFGGPVVGLFAGFLVRFGYIGIFGAYAVMVAGDFFPDSFYYWVGRYAHEKGWIERLSRKFTSKAAVIADNRAMLENLWKNHGKKMMLFSKQAYALAAPLLVSAGLAGMSYRRFLKYSLSITLAQYSVFILIGYFLGSSYAAAGPYVEYIRWILLAVAVGFIAAYILLQRRLRSSFMRMEKVQEGTAAEEIKR